MTSKSRSKGRREDRCIVRSMEPYRNNLSQHALRAGGFVRVIYHLQRQGGALAEFLPNAAPNELRRKDHVLVHVVGRYVDVQEVV